MRSWIWALVVGAVVVIAGAAFATGMIFGGGGDKPPRVDIVKPTPEEQELQKIRIAASAGELVEATHGVDGWIVRVKQDVRQLDPRQLQEATVRFFQRVSIIGRPDRSDILSSGRTCSRTFGGRRCRTSRSFGLVCNGRRSTASTGGG